MRQKTVEVLEEIYCCSQPWESPPIHAVGDRVYCRPLSEYKIVRGAVFDGMWIYYIPHNKDIVRIPEYALIQSDSTSSVDYGKCNFSIGDLVECDFLGIKRSLILGTIFNSTWKVAIANPNKPSLSGLPTIAVVPDSYVELL